MDKGEYTGATFLDLSKAFDTVNHGCLINKLKIYGIEGKKLEWFESYLFNRQQFVDYDGCKSSNESIITGVPQGSILGPLLFILLMNDLDLVLEKCNILLYADDAVIYRSNSSIEKIENDLNNDLEKVSLWFKNNSLVLNMKKGKTEFILFGTSKKLSKVELPSVHIDTIPVSHTSSYQYLGVIMDKSLNYYSSHFDRMYKRMSSRVKLLSKIRYDLSPYVAETIYRMMIFPLMFYCNNVFLGNSISRFETIQNRSYKIVHTTKTPCPWISVQNERKRRTAVDVFKYLNHIHIPENFDKCFSRTSHTINTRGNNSLLKIPKVRTSAGRKSFKFLGASTFNELPKDIRN